MSNRLKQIFDFTLILLVLLTASCKSKVAEEHAKMEEEQIIADITKLVKDLPPPSAVPNEIRRIGADFDHGLIADILEMESYLEEEDKAALNLGIFTTDIGYLIEYGQVEESIEHMKACDQFSETLGLPTAFSDSVIQQYRALKGDTVKLLELWDETEISHEEHFETEGRHTMAALVLTGSFIEGLYLAVKVAQTYHTDDMDQRTRDKILEPLVKLILEQEQPLLDIIKLLRDIPTDQTIAKMIAELSILERLFQGDLADVEAGMQNDSNFVVTQDMLLDVNLEVLRIRNEIVE